jgi:cytosine/adenosine deaminase-related metal-dependent hydrolase
MVQYLQLVSNTSSPTPLDIWTPSDEFIKPQIADQVAVGYFRNFKDGDYSLEVEELFYMATLGNAKVLSKDDIIGTVESGKKADLLVMDINPDQNIKELLSELIFVKGTEAVEEVYINGRELKRRVLSTDYTDYTDKKEI